MLFPPVFEKPADVAVLDFVNGAERRRASTRN
jgi:hypothetical protein